MTLPENDLHVVLIDDDNTLLKALSQALELEDIKVVAFNNPEEALKEISQDLDGIVISDIRMPQMDGIDLFRSIRAIDKDIPVILITGHADVPMVLSTLKEGAFDFLAKPINTDDLIVSAQRALETRRLVLENRALKSLAERVVERSELIGDTAIMRQLRNTVQKVAAAEIDVLIEGETGVGKDTVAMLIHQWSNRARRPFVKVNCASISSGLAESGFFGSSTAQGAYSRKERLGSLQRSDQGILYLDDIEALSDIAQGQLLPVIDERRFQPTGQQDYIDFNARIVASTQSDLSALVDKEAFRSDLYYRLHAVTIRIPPLRERREDIPLLFAYFLDEASRSLGKKVPALSAKVRKHLSDHLWPGNVRELSNFALATALGLSGMANNDGQSTPSLPEQMSVFEESVIRSTLLKTAGDVKATLELLGIPRKTFYDKVSRHQINLNRYRETSS